MTICPVCLWGQSFDWVPTHLLPFRVPHLYGVATARVAAAFERDEQVLQEGSLLCTTFDGGYGTSIAAGIGLEWWVLADAALSAWLGVGWTRTRYIGPGLSAPLVTGEVLRTEYVMTSSRTNLHLQVAARRRLALEYGWVRIGIEATVRFAPTVTQIEQVIEPTWYQFSTQPPTQQITLSRGISGGVEGLIGSVLAVGYDLPLFRGVYCSPSLEVAFPITLKRGQGRLWHIGVVVPVAFALQRW